MLLLFYFMLGIIPLLIASFFNFSDFPLIICLVSLLQQDRTSFCISPQQQLYLYHCKDILLNVCLSKLRIAQWKKKELHSVHSHQNPQDPEVANTPLSHFLFPYFLVFNIYIMLLIHTVSFLFIPVNQFKMLFFNIQNGEDLWAINNFNDVG